MMKFSISRLTRRLDTVNTSQFTKYREGYFLFKIQWLSVYYATQIQA